MGWEGIYLALRSWPGTAVWREASKCHRPGGRPLASYENGAAQVFDLQLTLEDNIGTRQQKTIQLCLCRGVIVGEGSGCLLLRHHRLGRHHPTCSYNLATLSCLDCSPTFRLRTVED